MPSRHKESYTEVDIKCPFYINDDRRSRTITCEGYMDNMNITSRFATLNDRDKLMGVYCVCKYEQCPLYKLTIKKYE